jgi:hypothetical protein
MNSLELFDGEIDGIVSKFFLLPETTTPAATADAIIAPRAAETIEKEKLDESL